MRSPGSSSARRPPRRRTSSVRSVDRGRRRRLPFLVTPVQDLLDRHPRHRTAHATLLSDIRGMFAGSPPARVGELAALAEPLESELRVLRYLPSNLSAPDIAGELFVSTSTVKTHMRHVYEKLGVHRRTEAVERARDLGLLAAATGAGRRGRRPTASSRRCPFEGFAVASRRQVGAAGELIRPPVRARASRVRAAARRCCGAGPQSSARRGRPRGA